MEPLLGHDSVAVLVDVEAVIAPGSFSVDENAERHGRSSFRRAHDEVDVARVKAERDLALPLVQNARPASDGPVAGESPGVERQPVRGGVAVRLSNEAPPGDAKFCACS